MRNLQSIFKNYKTILTNHVNTNKHIYKYTYRQNSQTFKKKMYYVDKMGT